MLNLGVIYVKNFLEVKKMAEFIAKLSYAYNSIVSLVLKIFTDLGLDTSVIPEYVYIQTIAE